MPEKSLLLFALILSMHLAATASHDVAVAAGSGTILLVDFGATAEDNTYGLAGWEVAFTGSHTDYTDTGTGGTTMTSGSSVYDDYQGITGTIPVELQYGHQIIVTWYNDSEAAISLASLVSFEDADNPDETPGEPQWYSMSETLIPPGGTGQSTYDIYDGSTNSGMGISAGTYSLVNVCVRSVDFQNVAVCDRIELTDSVDTIPPSQPQNLSAIAESDTAIALSWDASTDNIGVLEYRVYQDGIYTGRSWTDSFTCHGLQSGTEHTYTITAVDEKRNESENSLIATATTLGFPGGSSLINPLTDMSYLGAFRLPASDDIPYTWDYGGYGMTYYPGGDASDVGGSGDFPGSIYGFGHMWGPYISEISIPNPVISPTRNVSDLNTAIALQDFYDIKPYPEEFLLPMVDVEYLPKQGSQTTDKLYVILGDNYAWEKIPTHAACELDLSDPQTVGKWYIGSGSPYGEPFHFAYISFMFEIPQYWADVNTPGQLLISGGYREGGLVGLGPALFAIGPWSDAFDGTLPPSNAELTYTRLLQYGEDHTSTHFINGYSYGNELYVNADNWTGGAFLTTEGRSAVMLIGTRCMGECWYGWPDGTRSNYDVPTILGSGSKGYQASSTKAQFIFYDPDELAGVASGTMESYEPQPYAVLDVDEFLFCEDLGVNRTTRIASVCFDRERGILYVFEPEAYGYGSPLAHVWKVGLTPAPELDPGTAMIEAFSPVDLVVTDPLGRTISSDVSEIPSASYITEDQNGDGEPDDRVTIPDAILGKYSVQVVPEPGAEPTDTYILRASYSDETITLALNTMIQNIPPEPYSFFFPQYRLAEGWNLISIPVMPPDNALGSVLDSIDGQYESIWAYDSTGDAWERYIVGGPAFLNNLATVDPGKGYWVEMTNTAFLTMDGDVAADAPIPLQSGWCLVGYNCLVAKEPEEALLSIAGNYDSVWAYNTSEHDWERHLSDWPEFLSDLDVMTPGMGYWINAAVDCLWDVSATALPGAPATVSRKSHDSTNRPELPYTLWGSVEADGVKMTKKDECTVVLKVGDVARISYQLGSVKQYGDYYALDLPGSLAGLAQAELYVQFRDTIIKAVSAPTGRPGRVIRVDLSVQAAPKTSSLHQNFPNPFNPDTWIPYQLMEDAFVVIRIHSVTGQLIRTLELGHKRAGFYTNRDKAAFWDGRDEEGESVGSGIYFIHFEGGSFSAMRKMVMIR